jgi:acyl-CoA hydrolase
MKPVKFITHRLVKNEDLNHYGTLFAGRGAEWVVEAGFVSAAGLVDPKYILCAKIHGIKFTSAVRPGEILCFQSTIVDTGASSLTSYVAVYRRENKEKPIVNGFITFVYVDDNSRPRRHGITIEPQTEKLKELQVEARQLSLK